MKIRETTFNDLDDLDKYYPGHNHKQYLKGFNRRVDQTFWVMLTLMIDTVIFAL